MDRDTVDPTAGHYNDGNRAFLQSFMARGTLTLDEGQELLAAIFSIQEGKEVTKEEVTKEDFDSYISAAADAISPFDFEIRSTQDQRTKKRIYAIVNGVSDPLTQMATTRTTDEMLYIKRLIDAMFETYNRPRREVMAISSMEALQAKIRNGAGRQSDGASQTTEKGLKHDQAEKLLDNLVKEKWLERSRDGYYTLSPRALMELRSWLIDAYNESEDPEEWQRVKFCEACKEIITIGLRCANLECNVRLHTICQAAYFNSRPNKKCPKCSTDWAGKTFVGEKAVTTTEEYLRGRRRSGPSQRRAADEEQEQEEEEEEEEEEEAAEEEEEEEEEEPTHRPAPRRNGQRSHKVQSEDEDEAEEVIAPEPSRKRGRPRKVVDLPPEEDSDEE